MKDQQPKHVFISYVRENKKQVDRLYQDLKQNGVEVWLDRKSIKPGARWKDAIREAIRQGDFFIACFSDEYTSKTKSYMNEELTLATEELRQFASDREWFIPVLLSECDVPARSIGAGETLLDINWVPLYEDWDVGVQKILSVVRPIPPEIQNLINALRSENAYVRKSAADALRKVGFKVKAAVPALIEALEDEDMEIRVYAAQGLGNIGLEAKSAVPTLIKLLKDKNEKVRRQAAYALVSIDGSEAKAAVSAMIDALKDVDEEVRYSATRALARIGYEAKAAVPALIKILKDENEDVRRIASWALVRIGPEAVPALTEALEDKNAVIRSRAASSLRRIGLEAKAAVPALIEALKDEYEWVRGYAAQALEEINTPEAQKALEEYKQKSN